MDSRTFPGFAHSFMFAIQEILENRDTCSRHNRQTLVGSPTMDLDNERVFDGVNLFCTVMLHAMLPVIAQEIESNAIRSQFDDPE